MSVPSMAIEGRLFSVDGTAEVAGVSVAFTYRSTDGAGEHLTTITGQSGEFRFPVPAAPLESARIDADVDGAIAVDLEPGGQVLEPGEVMIVIGDTMPSYIRYGGV